MSNKLKIKTNYVPDWCRYITPGEVYTASQEAFGLYSFRGDDGKKQDTLIGGSAHLDGGSWEIVEE